MALTDRTHIMSRNNSAQHRYVFSWSIGKGKMSKNEGEQLVSDLNKSERNQTVESVKNFPLVQMVKGLWLFAEGVALLTVSIFAIYQAHFGHFQVWGKYSLTIAGVLVLVPAAILLGKFFRNVGKA
jgi:hypothetical protein